MNDTLAVDAGALAFGLAPARQARLRHILVSHSHLDHLASLPMLLDAVYDGSGDCLTVHGTAALLDCLRRDLFNNRLWPDFIAISEQAPPYLRLAAFTPGQTIELERLRITPVPVNHVVECMGFLIEDDHAAVAFSSDTGPTDELWRLASECKNLKAVFLEVTFPNNMAWLADRAKHLTPELAARERAKLPPDVPIFAVHLHSRHRKQVEDELTAAAIPNFSIARFGKEYDFSQAHGS